MNTPRTDAAKDLWESPYRLHGEGEDGWSTAAKFEVELADAQQELESAAHCIEVQADNIRKERERAEQAERRADEARVNALEEARVACVRVRSNRVGHGATQGWNAIADCIDAIEQLKEPK